MNFYEIVLDVLKQDQRFFAEDGTFMRNAVYEAAMQMDSDLIRLLLYNSETRKRFFREVDKVQVFDKVEFGWVINNRQFLPDSYTRFRNKIGLITGTREYISSSRNIELVFPYKDCVLVGGQTKEDQERKEVFFNETLVPDEIDRLLSKKVFTNAVRHSWAGDEDLAGNAISGKEHINKDKTISFLADDNLIIKGNNLLALSSLRDRYTRKIKCIYIDPPYNTGNDSFGYNDSFNESTWLTFINNRIEIAKDLLTNDGVLLCQCDDNEYAPLKMLLAEHFKNVKTINWQRASQRTVLGQGMTPIIDITEYILVCYNDDMSKCINRVKKTFPVLPTDESGEITDTFKKLTQQYNQLFEPGDKEHVKTITTNNGDEIKLFIHKKAKIQPVNKRGKTVEELYRYYLDDFEKLARYDHQQEESTVEQLILREVEEDKFYSTERVMRQGKKRAKLLYRTTTKTKLFIISASME